MLIKCPQCSTSYNIPDAKLGEKPRKMRCARCKSVFTVSRRSGSPPKGYEEFTGKQSALPEEFAFLKQAQDAEPPPAAKPEAPVAPTEEAGGVPETEPEPAPPAPPEQTAPPAPAPAPAAPPAPPAPPQAPAAAPQPAPDTETAAEEPQQSPDELDIEVAMPSVPPDATPAPAPTEAQAPVVTSDRTPPGATPVPDIYGDRGSAWETEAPLDLGNFAVDESPPPQGQFFGKLMTIFVVLVAGFLVFVAYRNGWSLSFAELPDQVTFALSSAKTEKLPSIVKGLEVTVDEKKVVLRDDGPPVIVVTGTIFNNTPVKLSGIVLRGRVSDSTGQVRAEARGPCAKAYTDEEIKKSSKGEITQSYRRDGAFLDCTVRGESSTLFQIVFEDSPPDYDPSFEFEIQPVTAKPAD